MRAVVPSERPDYQSRELESVAYQFAFFGEEEAPQLDAWLYQALCRGICEDSEILAIAVRAPKMQPPPNMLFGAVHYLLLKGARHPLREFYPMLAKGPCGEPGAAYGAFRDFCLAHRVEVEGLIRTRLTQTNVIQRTSCLLPAFATVFERGGRRPLALVEIGCSAGLNLAWDRFRYDYRRSDGEGVLGWGPAESPVDVPAEVRGSVALPEIPSEIPVQGRLGIDIHPIDVGDADAITWLRALVWPEHVGRQERLSAAIEVARAHPPEISAGDAAELLPAALAAAPSEATLCVYGTHTLYQFPKDALRAVFRAMRDGAAERPIFFISIESTGERCSELKLTEYRSGEWETVDLARCSPHGRWLEWCGDGR